MRTTNKHMMDQLRDAAEKSQAEKRQKMIEEDQKYRQLLDEQKQLKKLEKQQEIEAEKKLGFHLPTGRIVTEEEKQKQLEEFRRSVEQDRAEKEKQRQLQKQEQEAEKLRANQALEEMKKQALLNE